MASWAYVLVRVVGITVVAIAITYVVRYIVGRIEHRMAERFQEGSFGQKRAHTLAGLLRAVILAIVWITAVVMVLELVGVPVAPLLATAGIGGIAIGFGAQSLVRDVVSGFFILLENQYDVGDTIEVANVSGIVEAVGLRTTVLRGADGTRHVVSNGEIRISSNQTRIFSRSVLVLPMPYDVDVDRVIAIASEAGADLRSDPSWGPDIRGDIEILGVDAFGVARMDVKLTVETRPGRQWAVGRELRRRIKLRLDREGISFVAPTSQEQ
jgi:small-conductance mechanosensitive channel